MRAMRAVALFCFFSALAPLAAQTPLEDTRWRLIELDGQPQASPPGTRQLYLRLSAAARRFEGFAGCNTVAGGYAAEAAALKFTGIVSTRMACPALSIEDRFNRALHATTGWRIKDATLELTGGEAGAVLARFAADDPWQRVVALESGAEIRFTRRDAPGKPVTGIFDSADAARLVVVVKNAQMAVPKAEITLLEARPKGGSRVTRTGGVTQNQPLDRPPAAHPAERMRPVPPNSTSSSSSGLSIGSKPDFEVVYRAGR